jgi:hypothetical protein
VVKEGRKEGDEVFLLTFRFSSFRPAFIFLPFYFPSFLFLPSFLPTGVPSSLCSFIFLPLSFLPLSFFLSFSSFLPLSSFLYLPSFIFLPSFLP